MIHLNVKRKGGRTVLTLDAREFQTKLECLGAVPSADGTTYMDAPYTSTATRYVNASYNRVGTGALLRRGGPHEYDLAQHYGNNPPTLEAIKELVSEDNIRETARTVLEHYMPIDVSVSLVSPVRRNTP